MSIDLPISKSIANRILLLQAMHGDPLMEVSADMPDDVRLIHAILTQIIAPNSTILHLPQTTPYYLLPTTYYLSNCGTALRFLSAYCAQLEGADVVLDGCERLRERPIAQEVEALRACGAKIEYVDKEGYAPLHIIGTKLAPPENGLRIDNPLSTQMVSALLLIGIPVQTNSRSPYIAMTRSLITTPLQRGLGGVLEADWSASAFWYEYIALHGGEIELIGLKQDSLQGDRVVADLFRPLGVDTLYTDAGVRLTRTRTANLWPLCVNFSDCPDLYPAVKITCLQMGKPLIATGTSSLRLKESDRLLAFSPSRHLAISPSRHLAISPITSHHDHRIAMALLAADLPCDDTDCISKSYPAFVEQLTTSPLQRGLGGVSTIVPKRGINDDNLGKKHALHKLISSATTPYVWLQDDDVLSPPRLLASSPSCHLALPKADLYILPLRMQGGDTLLERLQQAEYAAIQEVTMRTAKRGRAVLCSGANMIVNRERWLESYPDLHPEIPSGDDMFLLESFRRRRLTVLAIDRPDYTATVSALTTWRAFFRQRMRWAGKAPKYSDRYIRRYGMMVLGANLLQLICPIVLLLKFPIEYSLIKKRDPKVSFWIALILEIVYPFYILLSLLGGLLSGCFSSLRRNW